MKDGTTDKRRTETSFNHEVQREWLVNIQNINLGPTDQGYQLDYSNAR